MSLPVEKRRQWIKSRREQRKLTKYARLRRQFLRYLVLLSMLSIGVFVFYRVHCHLYENKQGLTIRGNFVASNEQIFNALKSKSTNTPLFFVNPNELENNIKELGAVKHAFVRRYVLPRPLLKVEVLEEFPWASVCYFERQILMLKPNQQSIQKQLPNQQSIQKQLPKHHLS